MPDQYTAELRTACNEQGLSCRGPKGGYLSNATLERLLQRGGDPEQQQRLALRRERAIMHNAGNIYQQMATRIPQYFDLPHPLPHEDPSHEEFGLDPIDIDRRRVDAAEDFYTQEAREHEEALSQRIIGKMKAQRGGGPAGAGMQQEDDGPGFDVDAMEKKIREEFLEAVKGDSNEYVWELMDDIAGANLPENAVDEAHRKTELAFHQALLRVPLKQQIIDKTKELKEWYAEEGKGEFKPEQVEEDFEWLYNDVGGEIDYSDPGLLGIARNIYQGM